MQKVKTPRPKKCKVCHEMFSPRSSLQTVCSLGCAIEKVNQDKAKKERKETARKKVEARSRRDWLKLAQQAFNTFVRERDSHLPCISCGRHHNGQYHAGHYLTTGARPELRFDESNCHRQCAPCNNHLSGNIALYRVGLIKKIGLAEVERLEGPQPPQKWSIDELKGIIKIYTQKKKELQKIH